MTYEVKDPILQIIDHWQTLATGILAVLAALITVWATIRSATREISAAQQQTAVAQNQIDMTLRLERRRTARESYAFYMVLEAAMGIVIDDAAAAREIFTPSEHTGYSPAAYEARNRLRKSAFPELRNACLRLGGQLTAPFLGLDNSIDNFAAQSTPSQTGSGLQYRTGKIGGFLEELDGIEVAAKSLREEASNAIKRCLDELASLSPEPPGLR